MSLRKEIIEVLEVSHVEFSKKSNTQRLIKLLRNNLRVNWPRICEHRQLSEEFIEKFYDRMYWLQVSLVQPLSEDTIRKFKKLVNWTNISISQYLSEDLIRECSKKVDWYWVSREQQLSEDLIREFNNKVYWKLIGQYQCLSENFIKENMNKLDKRCISRYQRVSDNLIKELGLYKPGNNWLYATKEEKLAFIKKNTQFEVVEDKWVIAYKNVDQRNGSMFSHQYTYLPGNSYQGHCDCSLKEDVSFGLYAWTKERVMRYIPREKILKVRVEIEDIGAIVYNCSKIRCFKMEVLEEVSF